MFAGLEAALRLAGYDPIARMTEGRAFVLRESDDPVLGYEFAPGAAGEMWDTPLRINAHGLRERELAFEKPEGVKRVLAVGDSVTFGPQLDTTQRWSDLLQATWARWGLSVEVINIAVPGYDTTQEVVFLERKGLAYDPDEVILCFCVNDLATVSLDFETVVTLRRFRSGLLGWSRVAQWVTFQLDKRRRAESVADVYDAERIRIASAEIKPDPELDALIAGLHAAIERAGPVDPTPVPKEEKAFKDKRYRNDLLRFTELGRLQLARNAFARLAELSREHGFRVTVFVAPVSYEGLDPEGWRIAYDVVRHLAESEGFAFVDVYPDMKANGLETMQVRKNDYVHLNAHAHEVMARVLLRETRGWFERN